MSQPNPLRAYLQAIHTDWELEARGHPREEILIAHYKGRLTESWRKRVQLHLSQCERCRAAWRDVSDFFAPPDAGGGEIQEQWLNFRRVIGGGEHAAAAEPDAPRRVETPRLRGGWRVLVLSAALMLCLIFGSWVLMLRRENQRLRSALQTERQTSAEQVGKLLEQQNQLQAQVDNVLTRVAQSEQPEPNTPIHDLFSRDFFRQVGDRNALNEIKLAPSARSLVLVFNGDGQAEFPTYRLEMSDAQGTVVWQSSDVRRDVQGAYVLTLAKSFLPPGRYRFKVYGQRAARTTPLAEYLLAVE